MNHLANQLGRLRRWLFLQPDIHADYGREATSASLVWLAVAHTSVLAWLSLHTALLLPRLTPWADLPSDLSWELVVGGAGLLGSALFLAICALVWPSAREQVGRRHGALVVVGVAALLGWLAARAGLECPAHWLASPYGLGVLGVCLLVDLPVAVVSSLLAMSLGLLVATVSLAGFAAEFTPAAWGDVALLLVSGSAVAQVARRRRLQRFVRGWLSADDSRRALDELRRRKAVGTALMTASRHIARAASRTDEDLRTTQDRLQSLIRHSPDTILVLGPDLSVRFCNHPVGGILPALLTGRAWTEVVPEASRAEARDAVRRTLEQHEAFTLEHALADGTWWRWRLVPMRDGGHGQAQEVMLIGSDITGSRSVAQREEQLRESLLHASRMDSIGLLASGVAHDLNNLIGPLVGLPMLVREDLLQLRAHDPTRVDAMLEDLAVLQSSAERAARVVEDLLSLGRRGNYGMATQDLNRVVAEVLASPDIQAHALERQVPVPVLEPAESPVPVRGSGVHLGRVLTNLVRNAIDAVAPQCGRVTVRLGLRHVAEALAAHGGTVGLGDYVEVAVCDNGPGIAPAILPRIFEPFSTTKISSQRSGSGLGLAIVQRIVQDHDGHILVQSAPGTGSTFTLLFPFLSTVDAVDQPASKALRGGTEHLLVVEDDTAQQTTARRVLAKLGYDATVVASGRAAVALFAEHAGRGESPFALVLLDMVMQDTFDGLDTLEAIRQIRPQQAVIIVSAYARSERLLKALSLGASWVPKPYSIRDLADAIRGMLDPPNPAAAAAQGSSSSSPGAGGVVVSR